MANLKSVNQNKDKFILQIETNDPRGPAWATFDGIEGYHYTFLKSAARPMTLTEIVEHFHNRIGHEYTLEAVLDPNQ